MVRRPLVWECICIVAAFARAASGDFVSTDYDTYNDGAELGHRPHQEYHSSDEYSPIVQANIWERDSISETGSHIFVKHDGYRGSPKSSPLILDAHDLSTVYINRTFTNVFGPRVQENFGKKYLTFWAGDKGNGIGDGYGLVYDETYRLAYKVWAQNLKVKSDLHEFELTGNGTALVTGVDKIQVRGSDYPEEWGLPDDFEMLNSLFQEIDLETNEVIFEWRALDHVNPMDSFEPRGNGWDVYHTNSIEKTQAGNYLISIRHVHSIFLIDGKTGDIIWTLGGNQNDFEELPPPEGVDPIQPLLTMGWQHHAHYLPGTNETEMTFFDNHVKHTSQGKCNEECSRGLHIAINDTASPPTVQLLQEFRHPSQLQAQSQGNMQPLSPLPDDLGNVFIGWGRCPTFTEHNSTGETIMSVQLSPWHSEEVPDALDNYRSYKMDWSATPWWDPAIAPKKNSDGELVVYVSWNGATEVAKWVVRGAASEDEEGEVLTTSRRTGFETKLTIGKTMWRYLWAEAVDVYGNVLRSSEDVDVDTTELSVASDTYEYANSTFIPRIKPQPDPEPEPESESKPGSESVPIPIPKPKTQLESEPPGLSDTAWALMGAGSGVLILVIIGGVFVIVWHRYSNYDRVKAEDFDLDPADVYRDENVDGNHDDHDDRGAHDIKPQAREDDDNRALLPKTEKDGDIV